MAPPVAGYSIWYDAGDTATLTSSSNLLSQWNDKGSSGINLTQATGSLKPTTGLGTINSLNAVTFDGIDDYINNNTSGATFFQPYTIFGVAKCTDSGVTDRSWIGASGGSPLIGSRASGVNWYLDAGNAIAGGVADTGVHVYCAVVNGASSALYVDGHKVAYGDVSGNSFTGSIELSRSSKPWKGEICEVFLYQLTAFERADRVLNEAYCATRWGVTTMALTPPTLRQVQRVSRSWR